jgi:hypothetical protein
MTQEVSYWPLTEEAQGSTWVNQCGICCGQRGTETCFSPSSSVFSTNIVLPWLCIPMYHWGITKDPSVAAVQRHSLIQSI